MEIFKLLGTIEVDNDAANRALDDTGQKANETSGKFNEAFSKIGSFALGLGKMVVTAGLALGGAWIAAIEGSREYRAEMAKLDTAFVINGHSSETAKQTYSELNAVLGDSEQAVEAAQHLAKLTDNEKELQTWTDICTGVYATFGASLPIEGLTEAANETAKTGMLTGGLTDALNWAGIGEEEFQKKLDACTNEQRRQDLIMNTLNKTYSEASQQYQTTNKDVMEARKAQERLTDAFAELGRVGEPILTAIKGKIADMVTAAIPHLENLIKKVKDIKKWVQDNRNTINNWAAAIVAAGVSVGTFLLILNWGKIMAAAATAIKAVRSAVLLFNAALRANPIGLIISLLAGLVAGFLYLWRTNDDFRAFWIRLWDKIKSACSTAITGIKNKFNDLKTAAGNVKKWFEDMRKSVADKIGAAKDAVSKAVDKIKGFFPLKIGKIFSNLKIPKISVSGGKPPYGIAGKGSLPSFDIAWRAKGAVFDKPTIFNTRLGLQGVGDAGEEAVSPVSVLQDYIRDAVASQNGGIERAVREQGAALIRFLEQHMPSAVWLDGNALVGELTPAIDAGLSTRWQHTQRGNVR